MHKYTSSMLFQFRKKMKPWEEKQMVCGGLYHILNYGLK